jgi:hypothetical protein
MQNKGQKILLSSRVQRSFGFVEQDEGVLLTCEQLYYSPNDRQFAASCRRFRILDVTKRPRLTPPLLGRSIAWLADRRRDPTPINKEGRPPGPEAAEFRILAASLRLSRLSNPWLVYCDQDSSRQNIIAHLQVGEMVDQIILFAIASIRTLLLLHHQLFLIKI